MTSGLVRPVPMIGICCCVRGAGLAKCSIQNSSSSFAQPKNGRPVNVEDHSQLAFAGTLNLFLALGLDLIGRGFVAPKRARRTKAKEERYDEASCLESGYRARPCGSCRAGPRTGRP